MVVVIIVVVFVLAAVVTEEPFEAVEVFNSSVFVTCLVVVMFTKLFSGIDVVELYSLFAKVDEIRFLFDGSLLVPGASVSTVVGGFISGAENPDSNA